MAGGVEIAELAATRRFRKEYRRLDSTIRKLVDSALESLLTDPRPKKLRFEKLVGYQNPDIYTVHANGNFKISMEITGTLAVLRRVANHDSIDRAP